MKNSDKRVVLTGFMGVGKSSVARHLSNLMRWERKDLDYFIEENEGKKIAAIFELIGENEFRKLETNYLKSILDNSSAKIISLGGGAWISDVNREIIKDKDCICIWLESTFEHCWRNISLSKRKRPLANNKGQARRLFDERQKIYCLADWHFVIRPDFTSFDVAKNIAEQIFQWKAVER